MAVVAASPMDVRFRELNPFDCWIWIRLAEPLSKAERPFLEEVFNSWYYLGKLGAFNAGNLQVHGEGSDVSWMTYTRDETETSLTALMHNMGELEANDRWCRIWFDLGTSDAIALDILINALDTLDRDIVQVEEVVFGGINSDWPVEGYQEGFVEDPDR